MLAFSISGTYLVDLKDNTQQGRLAARLQPDFLSNFFANMIKMQFMVPSENCDSGAYRGNRDEFMKTISVDLFNFQVHIVYNNIFAVATMSLKKVDATMHQITTRYYFAQLWCEFTREVLTEFLEEDFLYKEQELSSFSIKNINESTVIPGGSEIAKRNFYLQLFRTYCQLP